MSDAVGCFLFGFGISGFLNTMILAATFKTLAASVAEMKQVNREGYAILAEIRAESRRKRRDDADYWKLGYDDEGED